MPFSSAIPSNAMKPIEAGTHRFWSVDHKATTPPTSAKGMFRRMRRVFFSDLKLLYSRRNMATSVIGTTTASRLFASRCR